MNGFIAAIVWWQATEVDILTLLGNTGLLSRVVLVLLLLGSVWSWGVIISKLLLFRRIRSESESFWKIFNQGRTLVEVRTASEMLRFTPLVAVLDAGLAAMGHGSRSASPPESVQRQGQPNLNILERMMQRSAIAQLTRLEHRLPFLATTAAVAPFVGLLGTVWGVLTSFAGLANESVATLRAVAPGIAEALIATAFGLFAAIPAVVAYNHFVTELRNIGGQMDDLQAEVLTVAEKGAS